MPIQVTLVLGPFPLYPVKRLSPWVDLTISCGWLIVNVHGNLLYNRLFQFASV